MPILHPQQFYSPKYKIGATDNKPDYRPTVFWEPDITTDANGKARVSFYTSDVKGIYTVKVAGMDDHGGLGDKIFKINDTHKTGNADQSNATKKAATKVPDTDKNSNSSPATKEPPHIE